MKNNFPFFWQSARWDCGLACLQMIFEYYKMNFSLELLKNNLPIIKNKLSLYQLYKIAESFGCDCIGLCISAEEFPKETLPCIALFDEEHFVVVYKIISENFYIADPRYGYMQLRKGEFFNHLINKENRKGIILLLSPY